MAQTAEAVQAQLDLTTPLTRITKHIPGATLDDFYTVGGGAHAGRSRWVQTTAAQTAAQQAAAILVGLLL